MMSGVVFLLACSEAPSPKVQKPLDAIVSSFQLLYKTGSKRVHANALYLISDEDCQDTVVTVAIEAALNDHVVSVFYDEPALEFGVLDNAHTWRVPVEQIPSWGNGPTTEWRYREEYEQAYFVPLADSITRQAKNVGDPVTFLVIIPAYLRNNVMAMYAEQQAHPAAVFYQCKSTSYPN